MARRATGHRPLHHLTEASLMPEPTRKDVPPPPSRPMPTEIGKKSLGGANVQKTPPPPPPPDKG